MAQLVKNPTAMQETRVQSLGWEDLLETEMTTQSSILAWKIPWTEEPGGLRSMGLQRVRHDWSNTAQNTSLFLYLLKDELRMFFLSETITDYPHTQSHDPLCLLVCCGQASHDTCIYQQISTKLNGSCLKDYELLEGNSCLFIFLSLATSIMCDTW